MRVRVCGPNLRIQSKGTFHVHADGCADLTKYGPGRKYGGDTNGEFETTLVVETYRDVSEAIYADIIDEQDPEDGVDWAEAYISDFHFAPCTKGLR